MNLDFQKSVENHRQDLPAITMDQYLRLVYIDELSKAGSRNDEKASSMLAEREVPLNPDFSEASLEKICILLEKLLRWQPEERLSAEKVIEDPFFTDAD